MSKKDELLITVTFGGLEKPTLEKASLGKSPMSEAFLDGYGESATASLKWKTADGEEYTYTPENPMPDYSWLEARQLAFELDAAKKKLEETRNDLAAAKSLGEFYNTENDKLCGLVATMSRSLSEEREMRETAEDDAAKNNSAVKVLSSSVDNLVRQRDALLNTIEKMKAENIKVTQDRDSALWELSRIHSWEDLSRKYLARLEEYEKREQLLKERLKGLFDEAT